MLENLDKICITISNNKGNLIWPSVLFYKETIEKFKQYKRLQ